MKDDLARSVAAIGDDQRLRDVLAEICEVTGMGFAAVAYVSEDRWIASQVDDRVDFGLAPGDELEVRKTICDDIRECGQLVMIDDSHSDPDWWNHPVPLLYGFRSYVSMPIVIDGQFFGTLCALDPEPRSSTLQALRDRLEQLALDATRLVAERMTSALALLPNPTLAE